MTIGEVSKKYGITAETLRYYERIGLIPPVPRQANGHRDYDELCCRRIELLKSFRGAGVRLSSLAEYLSLCDGSDDSRRMRLCILKGQRKMLADRICSLKCSPDRLDMRIRCESECKAR